MKITETQLRSAVRSHLQQSMNLFEDAEDATDELQRIIMKLDMGADINKSKLASAMKAGDGRNAIQNKLLADFFLGVLDSGDDIVKIVPLLKKAAAETITTDTP